MVYFKKKSQGTASFAGKVGLYNVVSNVVNNVMNHDLNLLHEINFENEAVTDVFEIRGFLFVCKGNMIQCIKVSRREDRSFHDETISVLFTEKVQNINFPLLFTNFSLYSS